VEKREGDVIVQRIEILQMEDAYRSRWECQIELWVNRTLLSRLNYWVLDVVYLSAHMFRLEFDTIRKLREDRRIMQPTLAFLLFVAMRPTLVFLLLVAMVTNSTGFVNVSIRAVE
jgi:hypothetical protein